MIKFIIAPRCQQSHFPRKVSCLSTIDNNRIMLNKKHIDILDQFYEIDIQIDIQIDSIFMRAIYKLLRVFLFLNFINK